MVETFRITLAQMNPTVGDIDGNVALIRQTWEEARAAGADLLACPEMAVTGHPAGDLLLKPAFCQAAMRAIEALARACAEGPALAVGGPWVEGTELYNAYLICRGGRIVSVQKKHHLACQDGVDDGRHFAPGDLAGPYAVNGLRIGSPVGSDADRSDVAETHTETGAEILLIPAASAYHREVFDLRLNHAVARTVETGLPVIWLNLVGGQGDLVSDGGAFGLNPHGEMAFKLPVFRETLVHVDLERRPKGWRIVPGEVAIHPDAREQDHHAMVLSLRDHMRKTGKLRAWLDLTGDTDAALVAVIAVDALGADHVRCVWLSSADTSGEDLQTARALTERLGCRFDVVAIDGAQAAVAGVVAPLAEDLAAKDLTARLRGLLLEVLAGPDALPLNAVNKSALAVGTALGSAEGSFNPIGDLYASRVADQCRWRNAAHRDWMQGPEGAVIPEQALAGSTDMGGDLDAVLHILVDLDGAVEDCVAAGHDRAMAADVAQRLNRSAGLRGAGTRLTRSAFGVDRRYPVVSGWRP